MTFRKPVVVYEKGDVKVYIIQCHAKERKTSVYAIRRDDKRGCACHLGGISFHPPWRRYVFLPDDSSVWCSDCMDGISGFLKRINDQWRQKIKGKQGM